jgi:hypothetical protein
MKEVRGDGPRLEPKCFQPLSSEVNLGWHPSVFNFLKKKKIIHEQWIIQRPHIISVHFLA